MLVTHLSVVLRYRLTTISGECDIFKVVLRYRLTTISGECDKSNDFGATALYAVAPFY